MRYYLGLGANLGRRAHNLAAAIERLLARAEAKLVAESSVYETEPVGIIDQPAFLNMAACVETEAAPEDLLREALAVERGLGRVREVRWGPRTIDIDLLLYDGPPIASADLELPHPRLGERQFVLVPLAEIAPDAMLPDGRVAREAADPTDDAIRRLGSLADCVAREVE